MAERIAMTIKFLRFGLVFVLALVVFLPACSHSKGGGCVGPTCPDYVDPPPDQTGLEPLGDAAPKHYLKDAAGNNTSMWVRLLEISPARRSTIVGLSMCGGVCYTVKVKAEIGKDDVEPRRDARIAFSLSANCNNPIKFVGDGTVAPGASVIIEAETFVRFDTIPAPKCLMAEGSHFRNEGGSIRGSYPLALEYQYGK